MEVAKEGNAKRLTLNERQELLRDLSQLDPDDSLQKIADELKAEINCEAVCILLWNEAERKLVTAYASGLPKNLKWPEKYGPEEGITGKYIFSQGRLVNGLIDLGAKSFVDTETGLPISDDTIKWEYMEAFQESSEFADFKSLLAAPCFYQNQKQGVVKLLNKIDSGTGRLAEEGFSDDDVKTLKVFLKTIQYILRNRLLSQIERLTQVTNDVLDKAMGKESMSDLYELILRETISFFGFDYGAISRVDYKTGRIKTESGKSAHPHLVNPEDWMTESDYSLADGDILVDLTRKKRSEVISGPEVEKNWDARLNRDIYNKYNHKELVRIYVPFIIREAGSAGPQEGGGEAKAVEEKVVGVIEAGYHISRRGHISEEKRALFELFVSYCAGAFQRLTLVEQKMAFDRILDKLNSQENLLSSAEEIYATLREVVEEYLKVETVSIWEKSTASEPFKLRRVAVSKSLEGQYDAEGARELPHDCLTAEAVKAARVVEIALDTVPAEQFAYPQIARRNNLGTMVIIPISIGRETYAVVDVFFGPERRLTAEEKEFLEHLAGRAAVAMIAVQNAKLVNSFNNISMTLLHDDIEDTLKSITESALEVLHANPVILFRYEHDQRKFTPELITSGYFFEPAVKDIPEEVKETDWPNIILGLAERAIYVESQEQYLEFQRRLKRVWRGDRFDQEFWFRERIQSSAGLRLEYKNEPVGVMFVNYRTPQRFNEPTRRLIEAFAAQAASAIAGAKLVQQDRLFWERQRVDSFSLSVSEVVASLAHNSGNLMNVLAMRFASLDEFVGKAGVRHVDKDKVQFFVGQLREPLEELAADFSRLEQYRNSIDDFKEEPCQVEELVDGSINLLKAKFERKKIDIKRSYQPLPEILCDPHQVQHMLLNLLLNALDAMGKRGTLSVGAEAKDGYVRIRITDSGKGIAAEHHSEIFKPFFTTKKHGSGLGLPISRYIAQRHGGRIDFATKTGKESTFYIYLPVAKQGE